MECALIRRVAQKWGIHGCPRCPCSDAIVPKSKQEHHAHNPALGLTIQFEGPKIFTPRLDSGRCVYVVVELTRNCQRCSIIGILTKQQRTQEMLTNTQEVRL